MKRTSFRNVFIFLAMIIMVPSGGSAAPSSQQAPGGANGPFKRIISLYAAHTENLFSLGLEREIIGVSRNETYPPQVAQKAVFSYHDGLEKFLAAGADLVLIRPMIARGYAKLVAQLEKAGIRVVSLQPRTVRGMYAYWRRLGLLTGRQARAEEMIDQFRHALAQIEKVVAGIPVSERKRVYFESIHSRMKTFSPDSITMFVLKSAGGVNVAADAHAVRRTNIAAYGKERILSHARDIDVYLAQRGAMNRTSRRRIQAEPGFQAIKAVRTGNVYIVDEKIVSRPTLRLLKGICKIGRILYPGRFEKAPCCLRH